MTETGDNFNLFEEGLNEASRKGLILRMGEIPVQETGELTLDLPELSTDRQAFMEERDPNKSYLFGCGDDRELTPESAAKLMAEYNLESVDAFQRYYGGTTGLARITAVSIATQYGAETLAKYGTSFHDFKAEILQRVKNATGGKIVLAEHSAEGAEDNKTELNLETEKGLGCAYDQSVGAVTGICAGVIEVDNLQDMVRGEQQVVIGTDLTESVKSANLDVAHQFFAADGTSASVTRQEILDLDEPVMILAGTHAKANEVEVNINFDPTKVSNPHGANEAGAAFYNNDATLAAELIIRALPELKLKPEVILAAMVYDIAAVREALAQHEDSNLHARDMKLVRYGNPAEAISYLQSIQASL